jgi:hypothetical protein
VGGEQQVQAAGDAQLLPRARRLLGPRVAQPHRRERRGGVAVDLVEHRGGTEALHQVSGPAGADVLDPPQVGDEHVGVLGSQRAGLCDLHLGAVAAVVNPAADDVGALTLLEVHERPDERHRLPVGRRGVEYRPAGLLVGVANVADRDG